ncbi:MAG: ThiF family adenylyltransferase [Gemmataceae bacterium]|nr:ThiF family adenylyltransferase [Gemmataceae bacterium]
MARLFQVGAGSGGMVVLDLLCREPQVDGIVLVEPDVYAPHNVVRHLLPPASVGQRKAEAAAAWVRERRPDLALDILMVDILQPEVQPLLLEAAQGCDVGICAVDNEPAKYAFDALMRRVGRPWTLGEVLSGGIGGWVHRFVPGGPCYGCVASYLQREVTEAPPAPPPDYSQPQAAQAELTIPASRAAIHTIASLHAMVTLELLTAPADPATTGFTSLLWSLRKVEDIFDEPYRSYRFRIPRAANCLICGIREQAATAGKDLDVAIDQALARLAPS